MPIRKKKKIHCRRKHKHKGFENHFLSYIGDDDIEYWHCISCKNEDVIELDRLNRIVAHEKKQRQEAEELRRIKREHREIEYQKRRKEHLWDYDVRKELLKGIKQSWKIEEIPKELLQLKRASMRLEELIKQKKKGIPTKKELKELELKQLEEQKKRDEEEIKKLNGILVKCDEHGDLYLKDVIRRGVSKYTGEQRYRCRQCMKKLHKNHYEENKEKVLKNCAEYRKKNPEKIKEIRRKYKEKCLG